MNKVMRSIKRWKFNKRKRPTSIFSRDTYFLHGPKRDVIHALSLRNSLASKSSERRPQSAEPLPETDQVREFRAVTASLSSLALGMAAGFVVHNGLLERGMTASAINSTPIEAVESSTLPVLIAPSHSTSEIGNVEHESRRLEYLDSGDKLLELRQRNGAALVPMVAELPAAQAERSIITDVVLRDGVPVQTVALVNDQKVIADAWVHTSRGDFAEVARQQTQIELLPQSETVATEKTSNRAEKSQQIQVEEHLHDVPGDIASVLTFKKSKAVTLAALGSGRTHMSLTLGGSETDPQLLDSWELDERAPVCEIPDQETAISTMVVYNGSLNALSDREFGKRLATAARDQIHQFVIYNERYHAIDYPMGDVPELFGVCTDVVIRAYRSLGIDLQELVARSDVGSGDRSIDHRRTRVLRQFFDRNAVSLPLSDFAEDYRAGDIVTYNRPQNRGSRYHIAIVAEEVGVSGRPMIIHNRGWGVQIEDALFVDEITGHYRFRTLPEAEHKAPNERSHPPVVRRASRKKKIRRKRRATRFVSQRRWRRKKRR